MRKIHALSMTILLAACAVPEQKPGREPGRLPAWPTASEPARIRWQSHVRQPEDLGIKARGFGRIWGTLAGEKQQGMVRPYAIDVQGSVFAVSDPGARMVHVFDQDKRRYLQIAPRDQHALRSPVGVAFSGDRLFVSDSDAGVVRVFDLAGDPLFSVDSFERPTGLTYHEASQRVYVVDTLANQVVALSHEGEELLRFGERGSAPGQMNYPTHIAHHGDTLVVNDTMNFRIQKFGLDGKFIGGFGKHGDSSGHFSQPKGVAVDSNGNIYVAGATIDRVQIFSPSGEFLLAFGGNGPGYGQFLMPAGLAIEDNLIYVADSYNQRVQVFEILDVE